MEELRKQHSAINNPEGRFNVEKHRERKSSKILPNGDYIACAKVTYEKESSCGSSYPDGDSRVRENDDISNSSPRKRGSRGDDGKIAPSLFAS